MTAKDHTVTGNIVKTQPDLDPADDFTHQPPEGVDRWAENIQWNVRDADGLGVMWHMGTMLEDPRLWHIVVAVTLSDGRVYSAKLVGPGVGNFGTPNAELTTLDPFCRWKFSFDGGMLDVTDHHGAEGAVADDRHHPVAIDLDLSAAHAVWIPAGSTQFGDWGKFHHEQAVNVNGTVTIAGKARELRGVGHRDHSIGPRDMSHLRSAFWGNGIFESGWAFATMLGVYDSGDFQRAAIFDSSGTREATMEAWTPLTTVRCDPLDVVVELDVQGEKTVIDGRVRNGMNFTVADGAEFCMGTHLDKPDRYFLTNFFVDWNCNGERGFGYLDRGSLIGLLSEGES